MKTAIPQFVIVVQIVCLASLQNALAVSPQPDGAYPNFTTAEGQNALQHLTSGVGNTAIGAYSLFNATTASYNTAVGAGALDLNTADGNTAVGAAALLLNTTGTDNTAIGVDALALTSIGTGNTATGANALRHSTGDINTATGDQALLANTSGGSNTAMGAGALANNTSGSSNIGVGESAGAFLTTGDNNIDIGNTGAAGDSNTIRIGNSSTQTATFVAGINGQISPSGLAVFVDPLGKLGTLTSSARFKNHIEPMQKASEAILALKPVTFRYKREFDPQEIPQFGLVAEDVEKVNPELVVRDKEGKAYSVRYEAVNAMLLNEFLKEHRRVEELQKSIAQQRKDFQAGMAQQRKDSEATAAQQQKQIEALTARLQKVSALLELNKAAPRTVKNTD